MQMLSKTNKPPVMARIGKVARRFLLVPLAATIMHGCSQDECQSHNETTIRINRTTDGTVASIDELKQEPQTGLMTEQLIKFVNETHAISSGGMPPEVYVTTVPEYCFNDLGAMAYAIPEYNSIYVRGPITIQSLGFSSLQHEIGHLQTAGDQGEAIPELSEIEQRLMGFAILAMQQTDNQQPIFFDAMLNNGTIHDLIERAYHFKQPNMEDSVTNAYDSLIWVDSDYVSAKVFFLLRLPKIDGDFSKLRKETVQLLELDSFEQETESEIKAAIAKYFSYKFDMETYGVYAYRAEVELTLFMAYFKELYRKFGSDAAALFFYNDSHDEAGLYYNPSKHIKTGYTLGFEEMDCKQTKINFDMYVGTVKCTNEEVCMELGATIKTAILDKTLCCVQVDPNSLNTGEPSFRKFIVHGSGYRYDNGITVQGGYINYNTVSVDGFQELYVDLLSKSKASEIGIDEPCQ